MSRKRSLYRIFTETVESYRMTEGISGVLVGYSGGADSTALLYAMRDYCNETGIALHAVHIHHGIRGEEADRDAEHCRVTCEQLSVGFTLFRADIPKIASETGKSVEEAARDYRYEAFSKCIADAPSLNCIATAHNADDNAETVLFNLARGSGSAGLCGIPPVRYHNGIRVIRPLICASKKEITDYCGENGIEYIFDSTNNDTAYTRNYIRHEILPRFYRINPSFLETVAGMANRLSSEREFIELCAEEFLRNNLCNGGINIAALNKEHRAVAAKAVALMFSESFGTGLESVHIDAILGLACKGNEGSMLNLCGNTSAYINSGVLYFGDPPTSEYPSFEYELKPGINRFDELGMAFFVNPGREISEDLQKDNETLKNIYKLSIHGRLNFDKINRVLTVRSRRDGDSYVYGKMTRKLKKLYNDRGISVEQRARIPVLCDAEGIVWVPGFPVADRVCPGGGQGEIIYYCN